MQAFQEDVLGADIIVFNDSLKINQLMKNSSIFEGISPRYESKIKEKNVTQDGFAKLLIRPVFFGMIMEAFYFLLFDLCGIFGCFF